MSVSMFFLLLAFISFVLAAIGVTWPRVNFGWLGLALFMASLLVNSGIFRLHS